MSAVAKVFFYPNRRIALFPIQKKVLSNDLSENVKVKIYVQKFICHLKFIEHKNKKIYLI
jgi:hypothetical protein